ncbi:uncharacterized protein LOC142240024 [Haematobia irritans]|uniref:uncharacterized protein LOC142240024 n=1 Tax=Haematobia irritans TaxID=7368 RepID=UPI003F506613
MDYYERMRIVSIYRHCAGCLAHDHTWRICKSEGRCKKCGDMHHTLLHKPGPRSSGIVVKSVVKRLGPRSSNPPDGPSSSNTISKSGPRSSEPSTNGPRSSTTKRRCILDDGKKFSLSPKEQSLSRDVVTYTSDGKIKNRSQHRRGEDLIPSYSIQELVMLRPTAVVKIICGDRYIQERAVIDPASEKTIIAESLVRKMGQKVMRIGNQQKCLLQLRGCYGISNTVETYAEVRHRFDILTPKKSVDIRIVDEYPGLQLADPLFYESGHVHLSLGGDIYAKIIRNGISGGAFGKPLAQFTIFGYIISGTCSP